MRSCLPAALAVIIAISPVSCGSSSPGNTSGSGSSGSSGTSAGSGSGSGASGGSATTGSSGNGGTGQTGSSGSAAGSGASTGSSGSSSGSSGTSAGSSGSSGAAGNSGSSGAGGTSAGASGTSTGGDGGGSTDSGMPTGGDGSVVCTATSVTTYPTLPGAVVSPLYTVSANGQSQFVEKLTKFTPEMEVHYANFAVPAGCTASISVTLTSSFNSVTVSPKSRNITTTKSGNTFTFNSGPNFLIVQVDTQDLLFILIDAAEVNPPQPSDADVKNIMDVSGIDNTGATLNTTQIQAAINAASGATQDILYFPAGKYSTGELAMADNMTLYLAAGAILQGSSKTGDYTVANGLTVENDSHALIHFINNKNTKILGRGVIDGNGVALRTSVGEGAAGDTGATGAALINAVRIDASNNITIDGVMSRDSSFWNTLIYESNNVTIQNYKVINQRPITTTYNQTDGVDFDASTMGLLSNAFLYTGDDNMATKTELNASQDTNGITHQHVVTYSNSGGCKIGTKTGGTTMQGIVWNDIDIVKAGRAMAVDGYDTAKVEGTIWENIRIEAADTSLIDINEDMPPTWRTAANMTVTDDSTFQNITSAVDKTVNLHGKNSTVNIDGVHFINFNVAGKAITAATSSWSEQDVINITFQ
jgi:hypothetical protein